MILVQTDRQYPESANSYKVEQEENGFIIRPVNLAGSSEWTAKGLKHKIVVDKETVKDSIKIVIGSKKIVLDYSEIQELLMAIRVYNRLEGQDTVLTEVREF